MQRQAVVLRKGMSNGLEIDPYRNQVTLEIRAEDDPKQLPVDADDHVSCSMIGDLRGISTCCDNSFHFFELMSKVLFLLYILKQ